MKLLVLAIERELRISGLRRLAAGLKRPFPIPSQEKEGGRCKG